MNDLAWIREELVRLGARAPTLARIDRVAAHLTGAIIELEEAVLLPDAPVCAYEALRILRGLRS